jgi:hypothetical protein
MADYARDAVMKTILSGNISSISDIKTLASNLAYRPFGGALRDEKRHVGGAEGSLNISIDHVKTRQVRHAKRKN